MRVRGLSELSQKLPLKRRNLPFLCKALLTNFMGKYQHQLQQKVMLEILITRKSYR